MFERFTERARQVVVFAQEEARGLVHNYIGTEHLLLGLLREQEGIGASVLISLGVTLEAVRAGIAGIVQPSEEATAGQIPFTPRAKKVLELSLREATGQGHPHVDTEHLLLALTLDRDGVGIRLMVELGAEPDQVRRRTLELMARPRSRVRAAAMDHAWMEDLNDTLLAIEPELRRRPDSGDLLLALAAASHTRAAAALQVLGVDPDRLQAAVREVRASAGPTAAELAFEIERVSAERERAAEAQDYERAAQLRDEERELGTRLKLASPGPQLIQQLRKRLLGE